MHGAIAITKRGLVPIATKVLQIQRAGGIGVVVVDDGDCIAYNQNCMAGSNRSLGQGFARLDIPSAW